MRHQTSKDLYTYWNTLRRGRVAPRRLEIQPGEIAPLLPDTFILERLDDALFAFRLAGTRTCARLAMDLRGANFLARWNGADGSMIAHHLAEIEETGRAGLLTFEARGATGEMRTFEILILPLLHTGSTIDRLLCSLSALDETTEPGDERLGPFRLVAVEAIWPEAPGEGEAVDRQSPLHAHVRNARIVRHNRRQFRVYDGGLANDAEKR